MYKLPCLVGAELRQSNVGIQKPMQRLCALGQIVQVAFENFGKAVEQGPKRPRSELLMSRIAPLSQNRRDLTWRAGANVCGADDEIVC